MKIGKAFDTNLIHKEYKKAQEMYNSDVVLIQRSKTYLKMDIFVKILLIILITFFVLYFVDSVLLDIIMACIISLLTVIWIYIKLIIYQLSFTIVTPYFIKQIVQEGIFSRSQKELKMQSIRVIDFAYDVILHSFFNVGNLIFASIGELGDDNDIVINHIDDPESMKDRIQILIHQKDFAG